MKDVNSTHCEHCFSVSIGYNTGEVGQHGNLDCVHCGVAEERVKLNSAMEDLYMIKQDEHFHAYQLGKAAAIAELLPILRKTWGHAIELGETDYFADPEFSKDEWSADCKEAAKLIAAHKK